MQASSSNSNILKGLTSLFYLVRKKLIAIAMTDWTDERNLERLALVTYQGLTGLTILLIYLAVIGNMIVQEFNDSSIIMFLAGMLINLLLGLLALSSEQ